jgi:hypothetical protein
MMPITLPVPISREGFFAVKPLTALQPTTPPKEWLTIITFLPSFVSVAMMSWICDMHGAIEVSGSLVPQKQT